jgi:hypothetical protein
LTVGIVARAVDGSLFCAADRMVTVGDIEMESPTTKIFMLTNSIVVIPSDDDAALHTEILNDTHAAAATAIPKESFQLRTRRVSRENNRSTFLL